MLDATKLKCPVCASPMEIAGGVCFCRGVKKHCFDLSSAGYLNLNMKNAKGDTKEQMTSRRFFLQTDAYGKLRDRICEILQENGVNSLLDAGCGEGYYTSGFADGFVAPERTVHGLDLSKDGITMAAKKAKATGLDVSYTVGSIFELPYLDESFDAVTNIFAPCCEEEFARVLKKEGILILVGAGKNHLMELKSVLYDNPYVNLGRNDLPQKLTHVSKESLTYAFTLTNHQEVESLFSMTPYYWKTSLADKEKLAPLQTLTTTADFDIFVYRKD